MSRLAEALDAQPYGAIPGYKAPGTSRDAALAFASRAATVRAEVLRAITAAGLAGLTADEAAARLGLSVLGVRPRVTELAKAAPPLLIPTGQKRRNDSGLMARVWRAA